MLQVSRRPDRGKGFRKSGKRFVKVALYRFRIFPERFDWRWSALFVPVAVVIRVRMGRREKVGSIKAQLLYFIAERFETLGKKFECEFQAHIISVPARCKISL